MQHLHKIMQLHSKRKPLNNKLLNLSKHNKLLHKSQQALAHG
jgi:hypothetical protein